MSLFDIGVVIVVLAAITLLWVATSDFGDGKE